MQRSAFIFSTFAPPLLRTHLLLFTLFLLATAPAFSQPAPVAPEHSEGGSSGDPSRHPVAPNPGRDPGESGTAPAPDQSLAAPANNEDPQIVVDKKNHAVRILIGGKEIAIIDASGMHVNGGLDYSGILKDTGGVRYAK